MTYAIQQLEGRDHIVVPMVMIVEGVLNGSGGPIFYGADELKRSVPLWNGKPVVVYHPDMYGASYAGKPDVFNRSKIGVIFHAKFEGVALKAEAWLDIARLETVDPRVLNAVKNKQMMEVSTGLMVGNDYTGGVFNGIAYDQTACDLVPDHLAILPDQEGACSIADGAGLCRNQVVALKQQDEVLDLMDMPWHEPDDESSNTSAGDDVLDLTPMF